MHYLVPQLHVYQQGMKHNFSEWYYLSSIRIMVYGSVRAFKSLKSYFSFTDSLYFGAIISATDPGETLDDKILIYFYFL